MAKMEAKESAAMTDFDAGTKTEKARHTQWRKLSRKRRRTLIHRSLRRLERQAKKKSVFVGMEDYSHVQSLVYSDLPYNPNGHHCSCNCLDGVVNSPELELNGWSYGKQLKSVESGEIPSSDSGKESSSNEMFAFEEGSTAEEGHSSIGVFKYENSNQFSESPRKLRSRDSLSRGEGGRHTRHSCHCDSVVSRGNNARRSINKQMFQAGMSPSTVCSNCQKVLESIGMFKNLSSSRRMSFAKDDGTLRSRIYALRQKLKHYNDLIERNKYLAVQEKVKRKLSLASRLQKKALMLSDEMKLMKVRESYFRSKNIQLKQRLDAGHQEIVDGDIQKEFEKFSIDLRSIQAENGKETEGKKETDNVSSYGLGYHSPRKTGRKRIEEELPALIEEDEESVRCIHSADGRIEHKLEGQAVKQLKKEPKSYDILYINHSDNEVEETGDDNYIKESDDTTKYNDVDKDVDNGENSNNYEYYGDHDAKSWPSENHDSLFSDLRRYHRSQRDDNYIEESDDRRKYNDTDKDDDNGENSDNNENYGDHFAKSWPTEYHDSFISDLRRHHRSQRGNRKKSMDDISQEISVRKLVHRLDSGLSFGPAAAETLQDPSLISSISRVEEEKISNSKISEDDYNKPLVERQRSFGDIIRAVIREEVSKKGSRSAEERGVKEDQEKELAQKEEMERREKLLKENLADFVEEAQKKRDILEGILSDRDSGIADARALDIEDGSSEDECIMNESEDSNDSGLVNKDMKRPKLVDLSTLRTLAQRHQTLKSLRNLEEEMYQVDKGTDKLNKSRMMEAKSNGLKEKDWESDELLAPSRTEQKYSIPHPINKKSMVEERIASNNKTISKIDYNYDLVRDLRFLLLNQNTSRAASYSYFNPAPPYLKTKWQHRIKRGFLRGVKEQHVNEMHLEKVEDVTLRKLDRTEIHRVTLQDKGKGKREKEGSISMDSSPPSRLSTARRNNTFTELITENTVVKLPPLKLPGSRSSSRAESVFDDSGNRSRTLSVIEDNDTLQQAFRRLDMRHKFLDKHIMMKNVIKLTSRVKKSDSYDGPNFRRDSSILETDRSMNEGNAEGRFTSRLKSNRRQSAAAVQNVAIRDPLSGRVSVNSNERRFSLQVQSIQEY